MDTRIFNSGRIQAGSVANGDMVIAGYAARYNLPSKPIAKNGEIFSERLMPGAFRNVLADPDLDCVALVNHDRNKILGRTPKTLRLHEDNLGLQFEVDLSPSISFHRDLYESVQRGDLNGCSFAFQVDEDEWSDGVDYPIRTVRSVRALSDVSVVVEPAYSHTQVYVRSDVDLCEVRSRLKQGNVPANRAQQVAYGCYFDDPRYAYQYRQILLGEARRESGDRKIVARRRAINEFLLA